MLHIFVEGPDDERYFTKIYGKCFGDFKLIKYAGLTPVKINNYIRSISCMPDCIFSLEMLMAKQPMKKRAY